MFPDALGKEQPLRDHAFSQFLIPPELQMVDVRRVWRQEKFPVRHSNHKATPLEVRARSKNLFDLNPSRPSMSPIQAKTGLEWATVIFESGFTQLFEIDLLVLVMLNAGANLLRCPSALCHP